MNRVLDCRNGNRRVLIDALNSSGIARFYIDDKLVREKPCDWPEGSNVNRTITRDAMAFVYDEET